MRMISERASWVFATLCILASVLLLGSDSGASDVLTWRIEPVRSLHDSVRPDLGEVALQVVATDPFRLDRRPAEVPFGSAPSSTTLPIRPVEVAPIVSGIVGPPWRAILEGVRARDGSVLVAKGDTLGGYRIVSVSTDLVVIQAQDTTWRLGVRKAW